MDPLVFIVTRNISRVCQGIQRDNLPTTFTHLFFKIYSQPQLYTIFKHISHSINIISFIPHPTLYRIAYISSLTPLNHI